MVDVIGATGFSVAEVLTTDAAEFSSPSTSFAPAPFWALASATTASAFRIACAGAAPIAFSVLDGVAGRFGDSATAGVDEDMSFPYPKYAAASKTTAAASTMSLLEGERFCVEARGGFFRWVCFGIGGGRDAGEADDALATTGKTGGVVAPLPFIGAVAGATVVAGTKGGAAGDAEIAAADLSFSLNLGGSDGTDAAGGCVSTAGDSGGAVTTGTALR